MNKANQKLNNVALVVENKLVSLEKEAGCFFINQRDREISKALMLIEEAKKRGLIA